MADTPTSITQTQYGFAPEVAPFAQDVLGQAQVLTDYSTNPYQKYTGEMVAGFSPLQQQSYDYAGQLTSSPQLQDATAMAGQAGLGALNTQYTYQPSDFGSAFNAATIRDAQGNVTGNSMMSPYMQNVVDVQQQQAKRQADIAAQQQKAQAANAGAFGGGRDAIMRAQANAELQRNLQGIQATGLQNAYQQAQQQYNTQQQQNAQQQQFGATLGMQGLQLANQAASNLGALGQTQYAQNVGTIGLQNQLGLQQQQQAQNVANANYQNWAAEQNDPYKRLGFYSDIVRGAPLTQTGSSIYQSSPTAIQNLTSLGLGAYGLSSLFGGAGAGQASKSAKGGLTKSYAYGGSVMSDAFKEYAVDHIDPRQLPVAQRNAAMRGDIQTAQDAQEQMAIDAALRRGVAGALPPGTDVVRAAGGGILAFADRGAVKSTGNPTYQDLIRQAMDVSYETPDAATRMANVKAGREGLSELYGPSEVDPMIQEDIARRQASIDEMGGRYAGLTALRMAAALQKPGTTSGGRWGGALEAGAEVGEKAMTAKAAAENELYKAKMAGAAARQARKDGFTDKAAAYEDAQAAHKFEADKLKSQAASHGAQTLGQLEGQRLHAAVAGRPTFEMQSVQAKIKEALAIDPTLKDDPKRLAKIEAQAYANVAKETRSAYSAMDRAQLTSDTALLKDDDQLGLLNLKLSQELMKKKPDPTEVERLQKAVALRTEQITGRGPKGSVSGDTNAPQSVTVGKQTYARPAGMDDQQWSAYQAYVKSQGAR